jgi:hypothetical protein
VAKTTKSARTDRQAVIEQMRKKQKSADRRRNSVIIVVCVAIAVAIVAYPTYTILRDKHEAAKFDNVALSDIGAPASVCGDITTKKATGNQEHVPVGTTVNYTDAPPAFGKHWNAAGIAPAPFSRKFYSADDRPQLEALVHNLEHGYTLMWYDQTIAKNSDALAEVKAISEKFGGGEDPRHKFIAVPWLPTDEGGASFPNGEHVAFTHWSAGGINVTDPSKQQGVFQYCSKVSGAALDSFMQKYPYFDSPEPTSM